MTVVINEFEVVVEARQPPAAPGARTPPPAAPVPAPSPAEIVLIQRRQQERLARVRAT